MSTSADNSLMKDSLLTLALILALAALSFAFSRFTIPESEKLTEEVITLEGQAAAAFLGSIRE